MSGARHVADRLQTTNKQSAPQHPHPTRQRILVCGRVVIAFLIIFIYFCLFGPARIRIILRQRALRRAELRAQDLERQEQVEREEQDALLMVKKRQ